MAKSSVRAIIFDIGRVIVRVDIRRAQLNLAKGVSLSPEELWSAIEKDPHWRDWQEGRFSPHDWHLHLSKRLNLSMNFEQFKAAWNSALDPDPIHPHDFFDRLSKSYKLGLLSNTDPLHVAHLERTYEFYRYFPEPVRTYSCSVGASKPDPLIFRQALRACRVQAQQAIYIDDIASYTDAARALGLQAIHYQSPPQLLQGLANCGVKVA
jgi:glucose-1-phosphatase